MVRHQIILKKLVLVAAVVQRPLIHPGLELAPVGTLSRARDVPLDPGAIVFPVERVDGDVGVAHDSLTENLEAVVCCEVG